MKKKILCVLLIITLLLIPKYLFAQGLVNCPAVSGAATPQGDAISWDYANLKIFAIGNNTNGVGYQESGFQEEVFSNGQTLTVLNGSNDYTFPGSSWTAGSANTSVGTFANGTIDFESNYYRRTSSSRIALLRTTTSGGFISGGSGHGVYIYPETGAQTNDYYTVNINFTTPVLSFSFDLVDIFDTNYDSGVVSQYEVYVNDNLIGYLSGTFLGDDGTGNLNLYDASGILKGAINSGQNLESNFGITSNTGISKVSVRHIVVSGQMAINTHEPHGLDTFAYSFDCKVDSCDASLSGYLDTDGDNISDVCDLDDDNDGILDTIEQNGDTTRDTDNDNYYDHLDIDSDNDGIPDNIEAQPTNSYISPTGTVNSTTGVDNAFTGGLALEDTDGDGIYDYLDDDSDNDGTPDIEENGDVNALSGSDTDNDGLDNNFDADNLTFDSNDEVSAGTVADLVNSFEDADGDVNSGGDLDYRDLFNINPPSSATIDFDGVDDYLTGDSVIFGLGDITIMAWVKIDASNAGVANATIAGEGIGCRLFVQSGNRLAFGARTTAGTTNNVYGLNVNYNEWHHVTGSFEGATGKLTIYVDGKIKTSTTNASLIGETFMGSGSWNGNFEVGRLSRDVTDKQYFAGSIDEVRVFNTALSDDQVQQMIYQEITNNSNKVKGTIIEKDIEDLTSSITIPWSNLIAYYPMTDIVNSTTSDCSNNNNTLKFVNITSVQPQTAPMPYETVSDGDWTSESTWLHGDVWDIEDVPNNKDWSIVNIKNTVTTSNSHTNLGLLIDAGSKLTVNGDNSIENTWYLELNGALDLKNDSQLLQSMNSDLVTSSTGKMLRRQEGTSSMYRYNYWASPIGVSGVTTLSDNNTTSNNDKNSDYSLGILKQPNGSSFQFTSSYHQAGKLSSYWLYTYKNGVTYYDYGALDANTALLPGVGYTQKGTGNSGSTQQYLFEGKPNNGTILIPVTDTGGSGSVPAVSKTDYLLGNPYASAIDLYKFIDDNSGVIDGTIQLWQQWSGDSHYLDEYNGGYAQVNKTGSTRAYQFVGIEGATTNSQGGTKVPTRYLPVAQGFMTEIVNSGKIVFRNSQRVFIKETDANGSHNNGSVFFRGGKGNEEKQNRSEQTDTEGNVLQKIRLEFNSVDGPATRRELLLGFSEFTSDEYDYGYDAKNVEVYGDDLNLVLEDEFMTIQAYSAITADKFVPLALNTSGSYNYTIQLTETENLSESQEIYLRDNLTDEYYDLRSETVYEFSSEAGEFADRFEIVFQSREASLSLTDQRIDDLNIYYASSRNKIVVLNPENKKIKQIELYSVLGQSVYKNNNIHDFVYNEFEVPNLSTGAYIIKLMTDDNAMLSKKIIVK
jgi:hypothetical protein